MPDSYRLMTNPLAEQLNISDPTVFFDTVGGKRREFIRVNYNRRVRHIVYLQDGESPDEALARFKKEKESHVDPREGMGPGMHPHEHLFSSDSVTHPKYPNEPHMRERLYERPQRAVPPEPVVPAEQREDGPRKVGRPRKHREGE